VLSPYFDKESANFPLLESGRKEGRDLALVYELGYYLWLQVKMNLWVENWRPNWNYFNEN
jgi:hypothetical protein